MSDGSDLAWLGLERDGDRSWSFELTPELTRPDGKLYGGTGIAVAIAAMEAETARDTLWTTVQFVSSADVGDRISCGVEVLAAGRRTSQVRITATVGDRVVLAALGATGLARDGGMQVQVGEMPDAGDPADAGPWGSTSSFRPAEGASWFAIAELRQAETADDRYAMWARMRSMPQTRATIAFLADMVPSAVVRAGGRMGGGTSLDNSARFGPEPAAGTEWILLDFDPYLAEGGYLHGGARIWSPDGTLLGVASQTAAEMVWPT
ncbi:MAG TPA: thioesterase family protein [Acidimicrobiales bacterium]|nr:thioesterase family protein [Acidimicrobiales bacterium]